MGASLGALATLKRESHPAYSAGWLPSCHPGGDADEDSSIAKRRQRLGAKLIVPPILRTHWWRVNDIAALPGEAS